MSQMTSRWPHRPPQCRRRLQNVSEESPKRQKSFHPLRKTYIIADSPPQPSQCPRWPKSSRRRPRRAPCARQEGPN
eukprot:4462576-Pyramimonas_sp.AAC.1